MTQERTIRQSLTFGFEQTFTTPNWWTDPGFVSTSDTPLKREKMLALAREIAEGLGGSFKESADMYGHLQYETFDGAGRASFVVTMDPGCIEVKTQPLLIDEIERTMAPLMAAAHVVDIVPYRNWWYGVRTGTEGGCHVNMGGFTHDTNPLVNQPLLVLKYAAFFHNNPWLHYPFMGVDVGPGGNAMRMDEHPLPAVGVEHASIARFRELPSHLASCPNPDALTVSSWFTDTLLMKDKHSAPSLYKFRSPFWLIEDRAVEALRSAAEFELIAELRVRVLEFLQTQDRVEELLDFGPSLHEEKLSCEWLWAGFVAMAARLKFASEPYRLFFERQFPVLSCGEGVPERILVREGRRPRIITAVQMRGHLVISKTIDTNHGRLELHCEGAEELLLNGHGFKTSYGRLIIDYQRPTENGLLEIRAGGESCRFHLNNMMFTGEALAPGALEILEARDGYARLRVESAN